MTEHIELTKQKIKKLLKTNKVFGGIFNFSRDNDADAYFDYDPISNSSFLEVFIQYLKDDYLIISYPHVSLEYISYEVTTKVCELRESDIMKKLRKNNSQLFNCSVDGTKIITGDSRTWGIFYDPYSDISLFFTDDSAIITDMDDYMIPLGK